MMNNSLPRRLPKMMWQNHPFQAEYLKISLTHYFVYLKPEGFKSSQHNLSVFKPTLIGQSSQNFPNISYFQANATYHSFLGYRKYNTTCYRMQHFFVTILLLFLFLFRILFYSIYNKCAIIAIQHRFRYPFAY